MAERSQISACASSPAVHMWHDECGAQASALAAAACRASDATGAAGNRMSSTATDDESKARHAMYLGSCLFHARRSSGVFSGVGDS